MTEGAVPERVRADAAKRATEAARLRVAGLPWRVIADRVGYAHETNAQRAVRSYFGSLPTPDRDADRAVVRDRIELLWASAYRDVLDRRPGAVRAATAVLQRAAALDGLDAPSSVELLSPTPEHYNAVLARMFEIDREMRGLGQGAIEADIFSDEYAEIVEDDEVDEVDAG